MTQFPIYAKRWLRLVKRYSSNGLNIDGKTTYLSKESNGHQRELVQILKCVSHLMVKEIYG
ncbi:hypothetical protein HPP92_015981 [Vanilla planifolia]|uniref:Uncharacterized protein n=1 Tax=Vanilla planifolia TaxID=51239 RepID=A0A835QJ53_VANPL|nr:hypothetical protein HPP92_016596 [Vanilla planifolia]KAG0471435.1 hypothetical protein HPP92_015981 [Vanilla planifolia]